MVRRIRFRPARITNDGFDHAFGLVERRLDAPKAAAGEDCGPRWWRRRILAVDRINKKRNRSAKEQDENKESFHNCRILDNAGSSLFRLLGLPVFNQAWASALLARQPKRLLTTLPLRVEAFRNAAILLRDRVGPGIVRCNA